MSTNPQLHTHRRCLFAKHGICAWLKRLPSLELWMQRRPGCIRELVLLVKGDPVNLEAMPSAASIPVSQAASLAYIWLDCQLLESPEDCLSLAALTRVKKC